MDKKHYKVAQNKENGEKNENFQYIPLERVASLIQEWSLWVD